MRTQFTEWTLKLQNELCQHLERIDQRAFFEEDVWQRKEGGGGKTRIMLQGRVFEKAGVNTSAVYGELTPTIKAQLQVEGTYFFACGISLVIHPLSPKIPTAHANYRYFEISNAQSKKVKAWFGGGADLTPYYLDTHDAVDFHQIHKQSCDRFDNAYYPKYKKQCDDYFVNTHRQGERRGIGGIFYDYEMANEQRSEEDLFALARSNGQAFMDAYLPIVQRHEHDTYSAEEKEWQLIRRGRYVEFNLLHDRGTTFGLKSGGRTESILMSLPLYAKFAYNPEVPKHSAEAALLEVLLHPRNWV